MHNVVPPGQCPFVFRDLGAADNLRVAWPISIRLSEQGISWLTHGMLLPSTLLIQEELSSGWSSATLPRIRSPAYDAAFMTAKISPRPSGLREKSQLMSASEIERTLVRLVHEIIEKNNRSEER